MLLQLNVGMASEPLKPFVSDGCSFFPDGTFEQHELWLACCTQHDVAYWQGGTYQQRLKADKALAACVVQVGEPEVAKLMLAGVRVGGAPLIPSPFRWGYGWPFPRDYKALTIEEKKAIEHHLNQFKNKLKAKH